MSPQTPTDLLVIDVRQFGQPESVAAHVLVGDEPVLVDPGPASTIPTLEAGLIAHGLSFRDIRALLLTHIHLDHAGAAGKLVATYPHLHVYVHAKGAPHSIDPSKLLASASMLYGPENMLRLWGEILPVPASHVTTLSGNEILPFGSRRIHVFDAPGHAPHHVVYLDEVDGTVFAGDVCGVRVARLGQYVRPATPPPQVDLVAWQATLAMVAALQPQYLALTHFGLLPDPQSHIAAFRTRLLRWAEEARQCVARGATEAEGAAALQALDDQEPDLQDHAVRLHYDVIASVLMSYQGLARYWTKRQGG